MNTCTLSQAKSKLGRLADAALRGEPTIIVRSGKMLLLGAYNPPVPVPSRPPGYFADCYGPADFDLERRLSRRLRPRRGR
ncbi:MAG TPA: hypothetical protein VFT34_12000 [Verrucomicrobiae bacterium]|nr:hypothetical protein [Verrucomicrobiae bacterium]